VEGSAVPKIDLPSAESESPAGYFWGAVSQQRSPKAS